MDVEEERLNRGGRNIRMKRLSKRRRHCWNER